MTGLTIALIAALTAAGIGILVWERVSYRRDLKRMEKMRGSKLYRDLYPYIQYAQRGAVDRVDIERYRVTFYGISPAGVMCRFVPREEGHHALSKAQIKTLSLLLPMDLPALRSFTHYKMQRSFTIRPNGVRDPAYYFVVRNAYKTALVREMKRQQEYGY